MSREEDDTVSSEERESAQAELHRPPRYLVVPPEMEARLAPLDERPMTPCKEEAASYAPEAGADSLDNPGIGGTGLE
ncbi:hypothetical protein J2T60_000261 [Natronospira proteinivora]|uniref:Uncharacterized protein n=1 Tax=Natronospira proteinivora TaxID=1807133 RepID=A0ABT1G4S7_9GAMM|nr:hypothetical protein [Natronospira proteinivora]MCP1726296.1 hypothetical protein [Natronospira proteinivora]